MNKYSMEQIAYIKNNYKEKFGIPRQSNLAASTESTIIFCEKYRDDNSLRELEGFSHIWLLWIFDKAQSDKVWSPTVRPPRLGGNKRVGVFATRSPFHPNRIGLSCVKLNSIEKDPVHGTVLKVSGADLLDSTPIIDIKPYLAFTDSRPDASGGFADSVLDYKLEVFFKTDISNISQNDLNDIIEILKQDPRPSYQNDNKRVYSMRYADMDIKFTVNNKELFVIEIKQLNGSE